MTVDEYEARMRSKLLEEGFDFNRPNPSVAWAVFKEMAAQQVESHDSYLFWEASENCFDLVREFQHRPENGAVWYEQLTIHFTCSPPLRLDVLPVTIFSRDHSNYDAFFKAVEARPEFVQGLEFRDWAVELRVDGV